MPLHKSLDRRLQGIALQRPINHERNLHRVDVRSLRIEQRMEQQTFLQRRQRQNVLNLRVLALQPCSLVRRKRNQRQIGSGSAVRCLRHSLGDSRQGLNCAMLEYRPRRDLKPRLARPAHQLDRHDAVAAQRKKTVVNADPRNAKNLGIQRAQNLLLRRPRQPNNLRRQIRRRQRATVKLAVRLSTATTPKPQTPTAPCSREGSRQAAPAAPPHRSRDPPPQPHRPPDASDRAHPRAPAPPPAPPQDAAAATASISPGSMRKPRSFTC